MKDTRYYTVKENTISINARFLCLLGKAARHTLHGHTERYKAHKTG